MDTHNPLNTVALRYQAIYLDISRDGIDMTSGITAPVTAFIARLAENGFSVTEELLHALNAVPVGTLVDITRHISDVMGVNLNWAPLVKGWNVPTGETRFDHLVTLLANLLKNHMDISGTTLPCGHLIPQGTFPIERYNGCPFCGTPFATTNWVYQGQSSKLRLLRLFTAADLECAYRALLESATPLDATQLESVGQLLQVLPLPSDVVINMKETLMLVVHHLVEQGRDTEAGTLLRTPTDVLRYLWYEKTGKVQIIEPRTLTHHARKLYSHMWAPLDRGADAAQAMRHQLRLKYDRRMCRRIAQWLTALPMSAEQAAEMMNPKRGMWVRMIHALRLGEYSRRQGFEPLARLLDVFYRHDYSTWQGRVDHARRSNAPDTVLSLLQQRPGTFSRCLFATMLHYGASRTLKTFDAVSDRLPARLLLSLCNNAQEYFAPTSGRWARPIIGGFRAIEPNKLLQLYSASDCQRMILGVMDIFRQSMARRFAAQPTKGGTIYIDPALNDIPVAVGDRSTTIQDTACALQGTRFKVEGDNVRLFMQWGKGLHAQHLDMDLSCAIALRESHHLPGAQGRRLNRESTSRQTLFCAFNNLVCVGAKHSGDIRSIPEMVGTAEYIELSLPELEQAGASYVTFTCNAYSHGAISPNLVVGWMSAEHPMQISEETGVAYDPSCVQHMVRISKGNLSKGLVFGVLDVARREIVWLEIPFDGQTLGGLDTDSVTAYLKRLRDKVTVGELLALKAEAQSLKPAKSADLADESYTLEWALDPAQVTRLLAL